MKLLNLIVLLVLCGCGKFFPGGSPTLTAIGVSPTQVSIHPAAAQQFEARGTFSDGSSANITSQVSWTASDTNIVTNITVSGLATGGATGTAIVTATKGSVSGVAALTVTP